MRPTCSISLAIAWLCLFGPTVSVAQSPTRIMILVDAFGVPSDLRPDCGFFALVEHEGKRILFDAGNNADIFAHDTHLFGVELTPSTSSSSPTGLATIRTGCTIC